jgi:hypothetical protein
MACTCASALVSMAEGETEHVQERNKADSKNRLKELQFWVNVLGRCSFLVTQQKC